MFLLCECSLEEELVEDGITGKTFHNSLELAALLKRYCSVEGAPALSKMSESLHPFPLSLFGCHVSFHEFVCTNRGYPEERDNRKLGGRVGQARSSPFCSHSHEPLTMAVRIHFFFFAFITWPYGVMVSHQLDVLRVPRSILGEANLFRFVFVCFSQKSGLSIIYIFLFLFFRKASERTRAREGDE